MGEPLQGRKQARIASRGAKSAETWQHWIKGRIRDDVLRLHQQRVIWDGMQQAISENPGLPRHSVLWEYMFDTYTVAQAAAIRRLAETQDGSASLGRLLTQIGSGDGGPVTRAWWTSTWATNWDLEAEGHERFDRIAGTGAAEFPAETALDDLARLRSSAATVKLWVDRYIAHVDRRGLALEQAPSLADLHAAIDLIRELYVRYSDLLTRSRRSEAQRELDMELSWRQPLTQPWIVAARDGVVVR
jgi:hypothetical protein